MKKLFSMAISILAVILLVSGCGKTPLPADTTCEQILNAALSVCENADIESEYLKSKDNFDGYKLSLWADGTYTESKEGDLFSDYAISIGTAGYTFEIAIFKASNEESISKLQALLERRKNTISGGDNSLYDPNFKIRFDNMKIKTDGPFVMLLMTDDNDKCLQAINNLKE